jgi:hypothetical protein
MSTFKTESFQQHTSGGMEEALQVALEGCVANNVNNIRNESFSLVNI